MRRIALANTTNTHCGTVKYGGQPTGSPVQGSREIMNENAKHPHTVCVGAIRGFALTCIFRRGIAFLYLVCALIVGAGGVVAQNDGGQFWVRLFEDVNQNGVRDSGEPVLTGGATVELQNMQNVTIATALLDSAPNAAQGLIGFQYLQPGDYRVFITAPLYLPTTESAFMRTISGDGLPEVVEFGGQRILSASDSTADAPRGLFGLPIFLGEPYQVSRVAAGLLGAFVVAAIMTALGTVITLIIGRPRNPRTITV
jgi:hypothetical protein